MNFKHVTSRAARVLFSFASYSLCLCLLFVAIGALTFAKIHRYKVQDAVLSGILWPLASTQWALNFSEDKLDQVKEGMTEESVARLLGEPLIKLRENSNNDQQWIYSWSAEVVCCGAYQGNFHRREVGFGSGRTVTTIRREFDPD